MPSCTGVVQAGNRRSIARNLHHAQPASPDRAQAFEIAQRGNVLRIRAGRLQDGLPFHGVDQFAIDAERDFFLRQDLTSLSSVMPVL